MTIILAIELFAINGRNRMIPATVRIDASKDKTEKNCSLNRRISISNQVSPGPGLGIALNTKMMIAVPIIIMR